MAPPFYGARPRLSQYRGIERQQAMRQGPSVTERIAAGVVSPGLMGYNMAKEAWGRIKSMPDWLPSAMQDPTSPQSIKDLTETLLEVMPTSASMGSVKFGKGGRNIPVSGGRKELWQRPWREVAGEAERTTAKREGMTVERWREVTGNKPLSEELASEWGIHGSQVRGAIEAGETIPINVIKDYVDADIDWAKSHAFDKYPESFPELTFEVIPATKQNIPAIKREGLKLESPLKFQRELQDTFNLSLKEGTEIRKKLQSGEMTFEEVALKYMKKTESTPKSIAYQKPKRYGKAGEYGVNVSKPKKAKFFENTGDLREPLRNTTLEQRMDMLATGGLKPVDSLNNERFYGALEDVRKAFDDNPQAVVKNAKLYEKLKNGSIADSELDTWLALTENQRIQSGKLYDYASDPDAILDMSPSGMILTPKNEIPAMRAREKRLRIEDYERAKKHYGEI